MYDKLGDKGMTSEAVVNALGGHADTKMAHSIIVDNSDYDGMRKVEMLSRLV